MIKRGFWWASLCSTHPTVIGFAVLVVFGFVLRGNLDAAAPRVGERYADFTLADIATGKGVSLSGFRGKRVLLIQFASW
jgi:hypothetical protein